MKSLKFESKSEVNLAKFEQVDKIYIPEDVNSIYISHIIDHVDRENKTNAIPYTCATAYCTDDSSFDYKGIQMVVFEEPEDFKKAQYIAFGRFYHKYSTAKIMDQKDFDAVMELLKSSDIGNVMVGLTTMYSFHITNVEYYQELTTAFNSRISDLNEIRDSLREDPDYNIFFNNYYYATKL